MKKITLIFCILGLAFGVSTFAQTNRVLVSVNWDDNSFQNKVEVYDPANNLLLSICNPNECYVENGDGDNDRFNATYDLGCLTLDPIALPNYYLKVYDVKGDGWNGNGNFVTVNVAGVDVLTNDGATADATGTVYNFNVNSTTYCSYPDSDGDFVIDAIDIDDDNDGILDAEEGLGIDNYNCTIPSLVFENGLYESGGDGSGTDLGSIYRFANALEGYDILVEIMDIDNTILVDIDDDGQDTPEFLQTRLQFTGNGTPGIEFKFTLVDAGTSNPSATIFRIGGTTWDCDGTAEYQESVRYYNPSAYGVDNPTSLTQDTYVDGAGITSGNVTYAGFATNTTLRSYFQFLSNTFTIRMQLKKTTNITRERLYAMSFTQCDILDYKSPQLVILSGNDTDGDGIYNQLDLDSDNDGIPDNVEAQSTTGYIAPSGIIDYVTGLDTAYPNGIVLVNTDDDDIFDYLDTDSDNDGTPDIEENGMADSIITFMDDDGDGLDNIFETNGTNDISFDVNEDIEVPATDLPDTDGDVALGGDVDYRDGLDVFYSSASIDFDGEDDYMDSDLSLDGMPQATIMAWVKLDPDFGDTSYIINQGDFEVGITANGTIFTSINGRTISVPDTYDFELNKWYHFTVIFDSSLPSDNLKLYVSGEFGISETHPSLLLPIDIWTSEKFTVGKESGDDKKYFKGSIDELRVFDIALTEGQMHQMVHQEITNYFGTVRGVVVPKDIIDFNTNTTIPWSSLKAYYPMTDVLASKTFDLSSNNYFAKLYNITSVQAQTAPMPYMTKADGNWNQMNTWMNGDVWDIAADPITKPWSIIKVSHNMTANNDIHSHALIIDANKSITMTGDNAISNQWYLELNGTLDLQDDSQLVQGPSSDLVTSASGQILRRQEGNSDVHWYNYWSSPVGTTAATSLSDNNGTTNNGNNTSFSIDMLLDGNGNAVEFTSAYDEVGKISDKWLYSFQNGITYWDWVTLAPSSAIQPGFGYTQKGMGNPGPEQQYIFQGKPNNGTILVSANDVDADGLNESEQDVTLTTSLIGNPYPSALDARKFISDNAGIIQGTILLWEQWAGESHWLAEYEGGYGFINNLATERAYQYPGINLADPAGLTQGIKVPSFNIPVGQGFFVEVINDGDIEFNNSQRVFIKESDSDGVDPNNGSSFFRNNATNVDESENADNPFQILRLEFSVSSGASRSFVLGFSEDATDGFDYGYDGGLITNPPADDMGSILDGQQYVIQAFAPITPEKEIDLIMHSSGIYTHSIKATEISNFPANQELFLRDKINDTYFDLRSGLKYDFTSEAGTFTDRFEVVFHDGTTLSNEETVFEDVVVFVKDNNLFVKGLDEQANSLRVTNMLGQTAKAFNEILNSEIENGIYLGELSSGVYLVNLITENGNTIDKKIILE
ncbi:MAG: T9SS type A sorting domain-containing protein [Flavobacteriaceae bacterium]|nr:T9SS type A sorting domain-containing protein [Flavobacteriaceae bacterium]